MSLPLVSVVIPTHNRCDRVGQAIESVLKQTYPNIEIIVVDDGSKDQTQQLLSDLTKAHPQLHFVRNEKPMGACAARNRGIREAKGSFVTGLDDDDFFSPERIDKLYKLYDDKYAFVCSRANRFTDDKFTTPSPLRSRFSRQRTYDINAILFQNRVGSQALIKRERVLAVGGFNERLKALQDYDLWVRLIEKYGPALATSEKLYNINKSDNYGRITNSRSRIIGLIQFYRNHRSKMSTAQKKNARLNILIEQKKPVSPQKAWSFMGWRTRRKAQRLLKLALNSRK